MKTEEEIKDKIRIMKSGLEKYVEHWNNRTPISSINGLPILLTQDVTYNIIKNQIEALEWVLQVTKNKRGL